MKSIFLLLVAIALNCDASYISSKYIKKAFEKNGIIADTYIYPPESYLKVSFPGGAQAKLGNYLDPSEVTGEPFLSWDAHQDCYYTLVSLNPDALTRANPEYREYRNWLVFNIPGDRVGAGDTAEAYSAGTAASEGDRRIIFLIFKQIKKIYYDGPILTADQTHERRSTSVVKLAKKYWLNDPVAGNFYLIAGKAPEKTAEQTPEKKTSKKGWLLGLFGK